MNLHHIVRGAITSVVPDVMCLLFVSTGSNATLVRGNTEPIYSEGILCKAQFQPMTVAQMNLSDKKISTTTTRRVYLYAVDNPSLRPWAQWRPLNRSGDYIKDRDENWWLIDSVLEDYSAEGWVCVQATLQTTPVNLRIEGQI